MESTKSWLNNLKIRGSWGKLGSQPGDYYPYQALMSSESAGFIIDGKYVTAVKVPGLVSPTLTWEKATTTNLGIDAAFLHNRLNLSFEIYERKTTDILTNGVVAYPSTLGASAPLENSGSIKAKGFELALQWKDKLDNGLRYSAEFTLYDARTKVLHYAANPTKNIGILYDGAYLNDIWGYETGGILQEADLVKNASGTGYTFNGPYHPGTNFYPGYIWYRDINGDGQINAGTSTVDNPGDRRVIGNSTPRYRYGFTGNVYYKGFDLNFFIQGVGKRDLWIGSNAYWGGGAGSQWMYDRSWTPERTDAEFPMYTATVNTQTKYLFNAAYLRLKQMVLGYTLLYSKYIDGHQNSWAYDRVAPFYDVQGSPIIFSDLFSDNMVKTGNASSRLNEGYIVPQSGTNEGWDWSNLRVINYFLRNYKQAENSVSDPAELNKWAAEAYFFKAWDYYKKALIFGEVPWLTTDLNINSPELYAPRTSREELMDSVLWCINFAVEHLPDNNNPVGRVNRDMANFLKARICLFEGTFRMYHTEIGLQSSANKFLTECVTASEAIMAKEGSAYSLYNTGTDPYWKMFTFKNTPSSDGNKEVILARVYDGQKLGHATQRYFDQNNGGASGRYSKGATRSLVDEYLCIDGRPIYTGGTQGSYVANPHFKGYDGLWTELENRDPRLRQTITVPGEYLTITTSGAGEMSVSKYGINYPAIGYNYTTAIGSSITGYLIHKHWMCDRTDCKRNTQRTTD